MQQIHLDLVQQIAKDRAQHQEAFLRLVADAQNKTNESHNAEMSHLSDKLEKLFVSSNKNNSSLSARLDSITTGLDVIEPGRAKSSNDIQSDEEIAPSPPKVSRFLKPPKSLSKSPAPSLQYTSKTGLLSGSPPPTQIQAQN